MNRESARRWRTCALNVRVRSRVRTEMRARARYAVTLSAPRRSNVRMSLAEWPGKPAGRSGGEGARAGPLHPASRRAVPTAPNRHERRRGRRDTRRNKLVGGARSSWSAGERLSLAAGRGAVWEASGPQIQYARAASSLPGTSVLRCSSSRAEGSCAARAALRHRGTTGSGGCEESRGSGRVGPHGNGPCAEEAHRVRAAIRLTGPANVAARVPFQGDILLRAVRSRHILTEVRSSSPTEPRARPVAPAGTLPGG